MARARRAVRVVITARARRAARVVGRLLLLLAFCLGGASDALGRPW